MTSLNNVNTRAERCTRGQDNSNSGLTQRFTGKDSTIDEDKRLRIQKENGNTQLIPIYKEKSVDHGDIPNKWVGFVLSNGDIRYIPIFYDLEKNGNSGSLGPSGPKTMSTGKFCNLCFSNCNSNYVNCQRCVSGCNECVSCQSCTSNCNGSCNGCDGYCQGCNDCYSGCNATCNGCRATCDGCYGCDSCQGCISPHGEHGTGTCPNCYTTSCSGCNDSCHGTHACCNTTGCGSSACGSNL